MLQEKVYYTDDREEPESRRVVRIKTYQTPAGSVFLRSWCSPSFIESLKVDEGLRAFARLPEREHQLLLSIARQPESRVTLAYDASGTIVGQVSSRHWITGGRVSRSPMRSPLRLARVGATWASRINCSLSRLSLSL